MSLSPKGTTMLNPATTSLPKKWAIEFTMVLRSRDVTGAAIGDALRHVEAFCADSGQTPDEAFGPAGAYADSLTDLPTVTAGATWTTRLAPSSLGLLGLLLALPTFDAWRASRAVTITVGALVALVVIGSVVALLALAPRIYRRRSSLSVVVVIGYLASMIAASLLTGTAATIPLWAGVLGSAGALLGSGLWQLRVIDPDVIVDPLVAPRRAGQALRLITAWLFPLLTLLALGIALLAPTPR